jgi:formate hydrogenlyase subunit 4
VTGAIAGGVALLLQAGLLLVAAPFLVGGVALLKARLAGRVGPPLSQPWRDLRRLAVKQPILAENASWLVEAAPVAAFAASLAAAVLVPGFALGMAGGGVSDLLVIAGLLALSRVVMALAAMDAGTAFGAIGASRIMAFGLFAEPAMLLIAFTLSLVAQTTNLDAIATLLAEGSAGLRVSLALSLLAMLAIAVTEAGRVPVDNPETHLELTMLHEATVLEYSGRHLAMLQWADALRLLLWLDLIGAIFAPFSLAPAGAPVLWPLGLLAWLLRTAVLAAALAGLETVMAKMRIFRVPEFLGAALLLGLLSVLLLFVSQGFV